MIKNNNILIPRRIEERKEKYKIVVQRQIQTYIKNGSVGDLNLRNAPIETLPDNLITVGGTFWLSRSQIKSLNNLESVGGSIYLWSTPIQSLGNLKSVGWTLDLDFTNIISLENVKSVGVSITLRRTPLAQKYTNEQILSMIEASKYDVTIV